MPTAAATICRPRHPHRIGLYRLFEQHFDRFVREYDERFEHVDASLCLGAVEFAETGQVAVHTTSDPTRADASSF